MGKHQPLRRMDLKVSYSIMEFDISRETFPRYLWLIKTLDEIRAT